MGLQLHHKVVLASDDEDSGQQSVERRRSRSGVLKQAVNSDKLCACRIVARLEGEVRMARVGIWLVN
jgi:hypothetical protein